MRDLLILTLAGGLSLLALRRPWIGILLWTWVSLMNPHRMGWGIAYSAPLAAIAAAVTVLGLMFTQDRQSPFLGPPVRWLLIFLVWLTLSWLLGENVPKDFELWSRIMKTCFMTLLAIVLLTHKKHILAFIWVAVFSLAILGVKGGLFTLATGGGNRVWGPPESFIEGNNEFALALVTIIPLMRFLQLQLTGKWTRWAMSAAIVLCAAAALGSHSRGAFLAAGALALMLWWRSDKKVMMGILISIVGLSLLLFMPEAWWSRMDTIQTYEQDASALGRFNGWIVATEVALHNFFGAGMSYQYPWFFARYGHYNQDIIAAHSIYFQILGNHGFVGLFLFMMVWISSYRCAGWLRKHPALPETRWAADFGGMAQVSLIAFGVGGAFLSLAYFDLPYYLLAALVLTRYWVERKAWETESPASYLELAGLRKPAPPPISGGRR